MDERELQAFLDQLMRESAEQRRAARAVTPVPDAAATEPEETPVPASTEPEEVPVPAATVPEEVPVPASTEPEEAPVPEPTEPEELPVPAATEPEETPVPEPTEPEALPEPEPAVSAGPEPSGAPERRHPVRDTLAGAVLVMLSLVGIAALVQTGISLVRRHTAGTQDPLPDTLGRCVLPLVLTDQPDFDDPDALTDDQFLSAAVISLMTEDRLSGYPDNLGMRVVPAAELTAQGNRIFGSSRAPQYRTFGISGEVRCYYDKEQDSYLIPASSRLFTYEPRIASYSREGDTVTAKVGYYAEQPAWMTGEAEYIKTVQYTLRQAGDTWQIRAAQQE